jgi:hypothetical protein
MGCFRNEDVARCWRVLTRLRYQSSATRSVLTWEVRVCDSRLWPDPFGHIVEVCVSAGSNSRIRIRRLCYYSVSIRTRPAGSPVVVLAFPCPILRSIREDDGIPMGAATQYCSVLWSAANARLAQFKTSFTRMSWFQSRWNVCFPSCFQWTFFDGPVWKLMHCCGLCHDIDVCPSHEEGDKNINFMNASTYGMKFQFCVNKRMTFKNICIPAERTSILHVGSTLR